MPRRAAVAWLLESAGTARAARWLMMKNDMQLKQQVEEELRWDPRLNAAQIGVSVEDGVVSLFGSVDTYAAKYAAANATKRVHGVRALAQDLSVKIQGDHIRTDADIAGAAQHALDWNVLVPKTVTVSVQDGYVTVEGSVSWKFQSDAAARATRYLAGVLGVYNVIVIEPPNSPKRVHEDVSAALHRQATHDANAIHVDVTGTTVTLSGHASSWQAMEDATNAAWAAPGVTEVLDRMHMTLPL